MASECHKLVNLAYNTLITVIICYNRGAKEAVCEEKEVTEGFDNGKNLTTRWVRRHLQGYGDDGVVVFEHCVRVSFACRPFRKPRNPRTFRHWGISAGLSLRGSFSPIRRFEWNTSTVRTYIMIGRVAIFGHNTSFIVAFKEVIQSTKYAV
jgi:hypothetical protein